MRNAGKRMTAWLLAVLVLLGGLGMTACEEQTAVSMTVDVLKIGKADCIVIDTGKSLIMIDTGEAENLPTIHSYMRNHQYEAIDLLILTHYDKDHIGGAASIISEYRVETVIEPPNPSGRSEYEQYHAALSEKGQSALAPTEDQSFTYDGCVFEINVPKKKRYAKKNENNSSLIVSVRCGERGFLFCGDAMELRLDEWLATSAAQYDFVKLPYHGNYLENYGAFLDAVKPQCVAITDSKRNPTATQTRNMLSERGIGIYCTQYGQIHAESDGKSLNVQ